MADPGFNMMITPTKPVNTATQAPARTPSPKNKVDIIVINIGVTKNKQVVSAMGNADKAKKKQYSF